MVPAVVAASGHGLDTSMTSVSVVVPVKDAGEELDRCVECILDQRFGGELEVIVVDNGSAEPVVNSWGDPVRVVVEPRPGSYTARNRGIDVATGDVLAFTDADCLASPDWLANGLDALGDPSSRVVVAGEVDVVVDESPGPAAIFDREYGFAIDQLVDAGWGVTANLFVPRSLVDAIGPFDAELFSGGDREFCLRATAAGARLVYAPDVVVDHPPRASVLDLVRRARRIAAGDVRYALRSHSRYRVALDAVWIMRPPIKVEPRLPALARRVGWPMAVRVLSVGCLLRVVHGMERLRILVGGRRVVDSHVRADEPDPG